MSRRHGGRPLRTVSSTVTTRAVLRAVGQLGAATVGEISARLERDADDVRPVLLDLVRHGQVERVVDGTAVLYAPVSIPESICSGGCVVLGVEQLLTVGRLGCRRCGMPAVSA